MKGQGVSFTPKESLDAILALINSEINGDRFAQTLREMIIPHLSFSQVAAVEFCGQRYYLDYIKGVQLDPMPNYFIKGKLMHQFIASTYLEIAKNRKINPTVYSKIIHRYYADHHRVHLENAVQVHMKNLWQGYEIVGVEKPFVILVDDDLPPLVGVIDLLLQRENEIVIVDHKTGNDFYSPNEMQMAIYQYYAEQNFPDFGIKIYYDHYRWVNNLNRIRKPPILRTEVSLPSDFWVKTLPRIRNAYKSMKKIREVGRGSLEGECFRCPFKQVCW